MKPAGYGNRRERVNGMKLNDDFAIQPMEEGVTVMVPLGEAGEKFHGIIRLNESAAFIVNLLRNEIDEAALIDAMSKEYDAEEERIAACVRRTLDALRQAGAVID